VGAVAESADGALAPWLLPSDLAKAFHDLDEPVVPLGAFAFRLVLLDRRHVGPLDWLGSGTGREGIGGDAAKVEAVASGGVARGVGLAGVAPDQAAVLPVSGEEIVHGHHQRLQRLLVPFRAAEGEHVQRLTQQRLVLLVLLVRARALTSLVLARALVEVHPERRPDGLAVGLGDTTQKWRGDDRLVGRRVQELFPRSGGEAGVSDCPQASASAGVRVGTSHQSQKRHEGQAERGTNGTVESARGQLLGRP